MEGRVRQAGEAEAEDDAEHDRVRAFRIAGLDGELLRGNRDAADAFGQFHVADDRVVHDRAAGLDVVLELFKRRAVHGDEQVGMIDDGRADAVFGDDDGAVGGAAALFGAVGRIPRDLLAGRLRGLRQHGAEAEDALSAETGDLHLRLLEVRILVFDGGGDVRDVEQLLEGFRREIALGADDGFGRGGVVAVIPEREFLHHFRVDPFVVGDGAFA